MGQDTVQEGKALKIFNNIRRHGGQIGKGRMKRDPMGTAISKCHLKLMTEMHL
jgi:hypothetical protein